MLEHLNADTLFATVAMFLAGESGCVLVVEGDDDYLVLKKHLGSDLSLIKGVGGRPRVLEVAKKSQGAQTDRARFLVDSDYDSFSDRPIDILTNVFYTATHDLFTDLMFANEHLLLDLIDFELELSRRVKPQNSSTPEEVRDDAFALASHLSAVRIVDHEANLCLKFRGFPFGNIKPEMQSAQYFAELVLSRSSAIEMDHTEFFSRVGTSRADMARLDHPPFGDHDLFAALASVLKRQGRSVAGRDLQERFMLTIQCQSVSSTRIFAQIQEWCDGLGFQGLECVGTRSAP